ncbi:hypothetical protein GUJ74_24715|uniref:hypothetical protein n=1 Tax=Escherichia coli TaxID=562 RepID=UPI001443FE5A|nr:hypothetical protein [Escherichia coli]NKQ99613.1 hypothetical protein [Escherichia coli]
MKGADEGKKVRRKDGKMREENRKGETKRKRGSGVKSNGYVGTKKTKEKNWKEAWSRVKTR